MTIDTHGWSIVTALVVCGPHVAYSIYKNTFDAGTTALLFMSGFAIPGALWSVETGVTGAKNLADLPSDWRTYVTVAGVVIFGLTLVAIRKAYGDAWKQAVPVAHRAEPGHLASVATERSAANPASGQTDAATGERASEQAERVGER